MSEDINHNDHSASEQVLSEQNDEWEPESREFDTTFQYVGEKRPSGGWATLVSKVRVENLLLANKDILALFYIISTWSDTQWYQFANMDDLPQYSEEYWRQLDMNRLVHSACSNIDSLQSEKEGCHFGDCISMAITCTRCHTESSYLETLHYLKRMSYQPDVEDGDRWPTIKPLIAMLLARDHIRLKAEDDFQKAFTPVDEAAKEYKANHWVEVYRATKAKYPTEYTINLKKHIDHWGTLSEREKGVYLARAQQIRDWCDQRPVCPGVPWW